MTTFLDAFRRRGFVAPPVPPTVRVAVVDNEAGLELSQVLWPFGITGRWWMKARLDN